MTILNIVGCRDTGNVFTLLVDTSTQRIRLIQDPVHDGAVLNPAWRGARGWCVRPPDMYRALKAIWLENTGNASLATSVFPMAIESNCSFEMVGGWDFEDDASRRLVKHASWTVVDHGVIVERWVNVHSHLVLDGDQAFYHQDPSDRQGTPFATRGPFNQAIKVYGDHAHGNVDARGYMAFSVRREGRLVTRCVSVYRPGDYSHPSPYLVVFPNPYTNKVMKAQEAAMRCQA